MRHDLIEVLFPDDEVFQACNAQDGDLNIALTVFEGDIQLAFMNDFVFLNDLNVDLCFSCYVLMPGMSVAAYQTIGQSH